MFRSIKKSGTSTGKDSLEFLSHAKNYISADFFSGSLIFISIPILTRILSPTDFGIIAIFVSTIKIFSIIFQSGLHGAVFRYYIEKKDDYPVFLGSNLIFILLFHFVLLTLLWFFKGYIASFFQISNDIFYIAVIVSSLTAVIQIYLAYLRASKRSKDYSLLTVIQKSSTLVLSVGIIVFLTNRKYMGQVYGELIIAFIFFVYISLKLKNISEFRFEKKHVKYSLAYGLPLIPHALSNVILGQFDRIIINQLKGSTDTGLYSFAYQVGMVMSAVVMGMNKSWHPMFCEKMEERKFPGIQNLARNYSNYIFFIAICLVMLSKEIVIIMADEKFYPALNLVPVIIIGYIFQFFYTLYVGYAFYYKKTPLIAVFTVIAGLTNIGLNYWLIPIFGYPAAAFTTLISFIVLFILHYLNVKYLLKPEGIIDLRIVLPKSCYVFLAGIMFFLINEYISFYLLALFLKLLFIAFSGVLIFGSNKLKKIIIKTINKK